LTELRQPLLATTLILPGDTEPLNDPHEIAQRLKSEVDAVIDAGACPAEPTTVLDLTEEMPSVIRLGRGSLESLGLVLD
jgi:tRNA A37 threonylcarbamoyladenosine synthetase subunit TsaC/SUA5/YrdC